MLSIREFRELALDAMKRCSKCGLIKPTDEFVRNKSKPDGYESRCKECHRRISRDRRQRPDVREQYRAYNRTPEHRAYMRAYNRQYRKNPEYRERMRAYHKARAEKRRNDPILREKDKTYRREQYRRRRKEILHDRNSDFRPGFVYICRLDRYYKIGKAKDVNTRLNQIDSASPFSVQLIHIIPTKDMAKTEWQLHERFSNKRINGEWFELSLQDIDSILTT